MVEGSFLGQVLWVYFTCWMEGSNAANAGRQRWRGRSGRQERYLVETESGEALLNLNREIEEELRSEGSFIEEEAGCGGGDVVRLARGGKGRWAGSRQLQVKVGRAAMGVGEKR